MDQNSRGKFTRLFFIAALWNICIAGSGFLLFDFINKLLFGFHKVIPYGPATFSLKIAYSLIFVFGLGYYIVSREIEKNRGIVWMGVFGKIFVFMIALSYFANENITLFCMFLACGDLVFAVLFVVFLIKTLSNGRSLLTEKVK